MQSKVLNVLKIVDWLILLMKSSLRDYSEEEFKKIIDSVYNSKLSDQEVEGLVDFFSDVILHPDHEDLLNYPVRCSIDDSPSAIIQELKRWYAEQGLACFRDS